MDAHAERWYRLRPNIGETYYSHCTREEAGLLVLLLDQEHPGRGYRYDTPTEDYMAELGSPIPNEINLENMLGHMDLGDTLERLAYRLKTHGLQLNVWHDPVLGVWYCLAGEEITRGQSPKRAVSRMVRRIECLRWAKSTAP